MSQTATVLQELQNGPVCSMSFYNDPDLTHRLAARIYDLRGMGHNIHAEPCTIHTHKSRAVRYYLVREGALF